MKYIYQKPVSSEIKLCSTPVICTSDVDGVGGSTSDYVYDEDPDFF